MDRRETDWNALVARANRPPAEAAARRWLAVLAAWTFGFLLGFLFAGAHP